MTEAWVDELIARSLKRDTAQVEARAWTLFAAQAIEWVKRDVRPTDDMIRAAWLDARTAARMGQ